MGAARRVALVCVAVVGLAAAACGGDDKNVVTEPSLQRGAQGVWALQTVNGSVMPILLGQDDTASLEMLASKMTLNSDNSFSEIFSLRWTLPTGIELEEDTTTGTYSTAGITLTFTPTSGGSYQMQLTNDTTMTENDPGLVLVYKRR